MDKMTLIWTSLVRFSFNYRRERRKCLQEIVSELREQAYDHLNRHLLRQNAAHNLRKIF